MFHRVILQSGTAISPWTMTPSHKQNSFALSSILECPAGDMVSFNSKTFLDCLRNVPAEMFGQANLAFQVSI